MAHLISVMTHLITMPLNNEFSSPCCGHKTEELRITCGSICVKILLATAATCCLWSSFESKRIPRLCTILKYVNAVPSKTKDWKVPKARWLNTHNHLVLLGFSLSLFFPNQIPTSCSTLGQDMDTITRD